MHTNNKKSTLLQLWNYLSRRRRKQFWLLLFLMNIASLAEIVSVGAVLPFLGVLTAPEQVFQHPLMQPVIQILELTDPSQLTLPLTIFFIINGDGTLLSKNNLLFSIFFLTKFKVQIYTIYQKTK
ncbi:hypothetical protein HOB87_04675 [Candidatus Woesearchaeota archaeon]|nr:hypothetical protein [Candidatus Woesearchaeota archaeon]